MVFCCFSLQHREDSVDKAIPLQKYIIQEEHMAEIRHIEEKDQLQLANIIRSVFEEYGAPLVNTVYDDPRTEHVFDALAGKNAEYWE